MAKLNADSTEHDLDTHVQEHLAKYRDDAHEPPYAERVEISHDRRLLLIQLSNTRRVVIPLEDIQGLSHATPAQLDRYEMLGEGQGLDWPGLNVSYSISGLLAGMYGNQLWMQQLRRKGGAAKSEVKQQASRANGAKGGRPRKAGGTAA